MPMLAMVLMATLAAFSAFAESAISLKLSAVQPTHLGQPIIVQVLITNNSSRLFEFDSVVGTVESDFSISVLRADGGTVSKTDYGRALAGQYSGPGDTAQEYSSTWESSQNIRLLPGESLTENIDLSKIFQIDRRGRYQVQVERRFENDSSAATVRSNRIAFNVQ
jgi:hypothetical protein